MIGVASAAGAQETDSPPLCFGQEATIFGRFKATLIGTNGPDVIVGGRYVEGRGGDDLICSLSGPDEVYAGSGDDQVDSGDNQDKIDGGPGDDHLIVGSWSSNYDQVPGGETVSYRNAPGPVSVNLVTHIATGEGTDTLGGVAEIEGSDYSDTLIGGSAYNGNEIWGFGGDDLIVGFDGEEEGGGEFLDGGRGDDQLHGGRGWETLRGGEGDDLIDGGEGKEGSVT